MQLQPFLSKASRKTSNGFPLSSTLTTVRLDFPFAEEDLISGRVHRKPDRPVVISNSVMQHSSFLVSIAWYAHDKPCMQQVHPRQRHFLSLNKFAFAGAAAAYPTDLSSVM